MKKLATLIMFALFTLMVPGLAMASEIPEKAVTALALGAALSIGLAAFGGALAQGKASAAAVEGIARNPGSKGNVQTPMIIGLALIESLVIYALLIAFMLQGKIDKLLG